MVGSIAPNGISTRHGKPVDLDGQKVTGPAVANLVPEVGEIYRPGIRAHEDEFGHDTAPEEGPFVRQPLSRNLG